MEMNEKDASMQAVQFYNNDNGYAKEGQAQNVNWWIKALYPSIQFLDKKVIHVSRIVKVYQVVDRIISTQTKTKLKKDTP